MRRLLMLLVASASLIVGCQNVIRNDDFDAQGTQLLANHNDIRISHNLTTLQTNDMLMLAATKHAQYMAQTDRLSHYGPNKTRPSNRAIAEGYDYYMVAENIGAGYEDIESLMKAWMRSHGHKKNILGIYEDVGYGAARSNSGRLYWCVMFATPRKCR